MTPSDTEARAQVGRILQSDVFVHSDTLRRLLAYLAERSLSGEADQLKEYTIGVDLFGKGQSYDPRLDSGVRIHISRLRQRLADYYAANGKNDEIQVTIPRGQFKLLFEREAAVPAIPAIEPEILTEPGTSGIQAKPSELPWRRIAVLLAGALVIAVIAAGISTIALVRAKRSEGIDPRWTSATQAFWSPFTESDRPLVIAVGAPLFIGMQGRYLFRNLDRTTWEDAIQDPIFKTFRKQLNNPDFFAVRLYTSVGTTNSALVLGTLLARRVPAIRFARATDLSSQQLSDSNVLLLGGARNFADLLYSLPINAEMTLEQTGLRVLHPDNGQPAFLPDQTADTMAGGIAPPDDPDAHAGDIYALISILPGPSGQGFLGSFSASTLGGVLAAAEYVTTPTSVETLLAQLKGRSGHIPRYFQVALKVSFRGGVPINSRLFLTREVRVAQPPKER